MTSKLNIHQRLANVMNEVSYIQKDKKDGMKYSIVSHDKVTAKVRPALLKHGIVYYPVMLEHSQNGNRTEVTMSIKFVNIENQDDYFVVPSLGFGIDNQDKGPGKAISYAVKYALLKALGLETGDDPDLEQEAEHKSQAHQWSEGVIAEIQNAEDLDILHSIKLREDTNVKTYWNKDKTSSQNVMSAMKQAEKKLNPRPELTTDQA